MLFSIFRPLSSGSSFIIVLIFLGFDIEHEVVDLKSISSVRLLGFVWDLFEASFMRNFCILPLNLEGELAVTPMKFIANLLARVCLYFRAVF